MTDWIYCLHLQDKVTAYRYGLVLPLPQGAQAECRVAQGLRGNPRLESSVSKKKIKSRS